MLNNEKELADLAVRLFNNIDQAEQFNVNELFYHCDNKFLLQLIEELAETVRENVTERSKRFSQRSEAVSLSPCKHFKRTTDVVEVKHGEWKIIADYKESEIAQCTNCKEEFWYMKQGQLQIKLMPYCPKCGAKMDGKDINVRSKGGSEINGNR